MPKPIVLVGALDTKGAEFQFVRELLQAQGLETILVDFGVVGEPAVPPDIGSDEVARAAGSSLAELRSKGDKTLAMRTMAEGLTRVVGELYAAGRLGGILGMAGSGGTAIATAAMRALPTGVPKLMVSTVAAGDIAPYVGTKDITMMPSVVDVAGINRFSRQIYTNAAGAIAGMVRMEAPAAAEDKPLITASMFGNTTPCVNHAKALLEAQGYEVLVFHATGTGGRTMESLIEAGYIAANLDITTTELADEVCGGVLSAGPDRLMAAARRGIPTVLVPGCVDMANFWARSTVPERYRDRTLYEWNPNVTLMRTNVEENRRIGEMIAAAANASTGPVAILLPLKGVSQLDSPGGPFWDPEADAACYEAIKAHLKPGIPVIEMDNNINDPAFAEKAVDVLLTMLRS
ncbi:MAG: Tm-1-like ATP-binding domain-containing protein [Caldilineales bacterium]|nr:Tm-1-like ATP-binding domain-containing protein [Caldilineales bacterium]